MENAGAEMQRLMNVNVLEDILVGVAITILVLVERANTAAM